MIIKGAAGATGDAAAAAAGGSAGASRAGVLARAVRGRAAPMAVAHFEIRAK